jgi:hypothetical protein
MRKVLFSAFLLLAAASLLAQAAGAGPDLGQLAKDVDKVYTVAKGDTLQSVANKAYGDYRAWAALWAANSEAIANPDKIEVGDKITLYKVSAKAIEASLMAEAYLAAYERFVYLGQDFADQRRWVLLEARAFSPEVFVIAKDRILVEDELWYGARPDGLAAFDGVLASYMAKAFALAITSKDGNVATQAFAFAEGASVTRLDQPVAWLEAARKGLKVSVLLKAGAVTSVKLPIYGLEARGIAAYGGQPRWISVRDVRVNSTDSSLAAPSEAKDALGRVSTKVEIAESAPIADDVWARSNAKKLDIGNVFIVPDSVKVNLNGKDLAVVYATDGKGLFTGDPGSSCIVDSTKNFVTIQFDVELGATYDDVAKILVASWQKKMFKQTTTEYVYKEMAPEAIVEFQGQPASLATAIYVGNYVLFRCDTSDKVIHLDSYLVDREVQVTAASASDISVYYLNDGKPESFGTVNLSAGATIAGATGAPIAPADLVGKKALVTTEPADGYGAILVALKD